MRRPPLDVSYLRDHAETRGFMLGRPVRPRPTPDGRAVLFLRARPRTPRLTLYELDVATGRTRELLTPERLLAGAAETVSAEEQARRERQRIALGGFTDFDLSDDGRRILLSLSGQLHVVERASGAVLSLPVGEGTVLDPRFAPGGDAIAFVRDHDLYTLELDALRERRLTTGGSEAVTHGLAEFVAQEEMGRHAGYWWSPDARAVAYEEADSRAVDIWWLADPARPARPPHAVRYPRPGRANAVVRLGIVPARGGDTVWVRWDAHRYQYLTAVRWEEHGPLCVAVQSRDQRELALLRVDASTGATAPLVVERDPAWTPVKRDVPRWLSRDEGFLWSREVGGERRLELRAPDGRVRRIVHRQRGGHLELLHVDRARGRVLLRTSQDPSQSHVVAIPLAGGAPLRLTREPGVHTATCAKDAPVCVVESLRPHAMPRAFVAGEDGRELCELPSVAAEPPFIVDSVIAQAGGFYTCVVRPHRLDPRRKYPVLVDVYGGPGQNKVTASMGPRLVPQWLANLGFILVSIDNRGTPGRGRGWDRPLRGRVGAVPLEDQVAGLRALARKHREMDLTRVGIVGWSYGGYLSALAVLDRPDVFHAAVAGAPVADWEDYDTHYTERYMGLPEKNRAAYREASLLTRAAKLARPLLIVHGTADDNVFFVHALKLADALFRAGRPFEMLPLAALTHMVPEPVVMQRLWARIAEHFRTHLAAGVPRRSRRGR